MASAGERHRRHGHVNNTVHWQAVEHLLAADGLDKRQPLRARLDYREPLDFGDELELVASGDASRLDVGFVTAVGVKAVAALESLA